MNDTLLLITVLVWMVCQAATIGIVCPVIIKELRMIRGLIALDSALDTYRPSEDRKNGKNGKNGTRSVLSPYKDDRRISK